MVTVEQAQAELDAARAASRDAAALAKRVRTRANVHAANVAHTRWRQAIKVAERVVKAAEAAAKRGSDG